MHGDYHILPHELAVNPGIHAASIGAVLATLAHALPDMAAILPALYYALLIVDHFQDRWKRHKNSKPRRHHNEHSR